MIEKLLFSNCENNIKSTEEHDKILYKICALEDVLLKILNENEKKSFLEYSNLTFDFASESQKAGYIAEFKSGMKLAVEVFNDK